MTILVQPEYMERAAQMESNATFATQARIVDLDVSYKSDLALEI